MAKRRRVSSAEEDRKCVDQCSSIDRISILPDEILVLVLSFLTLQEAIATSTLSSRWRYLWTFTPKLDFIDKKLLLIARVREGLPGFGLFGLSKERRKYVEWVNQGIALHNKSSIVEEFRVVFDLTKSYKRCIYKWLRYALSKKVQRLVLDFTPCYFDRDDDKYFTFPYKLLRREKEKVSNAPQSWSLRQHNSIDFKYLKKVSFYYVNVNGEALEFLLRKFPALEDVCVFASFHLSSVKIVGPFQAFKRLEISFCDNLESLEIRDANLVYLKYRGSNKHFLIDNVPMLVEIFVGGLITRNMEDVISMLLSCLPQLEILTIDTKFNFPRLSTWEETEISYSAVRMSNLKQLMVKIDICRQSLLPLTNLMRGSPCLERFVLEVKRQGLEIVKREFEKIAWSYSHLKEVELLGYYGATTELELIMHFVDNAVALDKILVEPRMPDYYFELGEFVEDKMAAMARAKQELTSIVPPRINLKILE